MELNRKSNRAPKKLLVEGGGSHTLVLVTEGENVIVEKKFSSLNRVGQSGSIQEDIISDIATIFSEHSNLDSCYFAIGAAATPKYLKEVSRVIEQKWLEHELCWQNIIISNDIVPLLFSASVEKNQLIAISGTGSGIAARKCFNKIVRGGANEYLLGDEGGAFDIGQRGLRAVLKMRQGRGEKTCLNQLAQEWTKGEEINWFVYESLSPKKTIASFSSMVFLADSEGDKVAKEIMDIAATNLAEICESTLARLGWPNEVIVTCTGTLLNESTHCLRSRLQNILSRHSQIDKFETIEIDSSLLSRTAEQLICFPEKLSSIAKTIPVVRI